MNIDWFDRVAPGIGVCIEQLGCATFYPHFFAMIKAVAPVNQYMVFEFSPRGDAVCRLAHNVEQPDLGIALAHQYLEGYHLEDPLLRTLKESLINSPDKPFCQLLEKRVLPPVYRKHFFNVPNLATKFAFVVVDKESQHLFYINFYGEDQGVFSDVSLIALNKMSGVIGSLLLKHFRDERKQRGVVQSLRVAGLSEREAQICDLILHGHTAKTIAQTLEVAESTVITYKKRAFTKLAITHKSQLLPFV